ncbi:hypothetical protein [Actinoplanes sp. NPDC049802]|uniref:hypothetical protein n=1 Tax=Actinoplanes sp. NPDC049802 TaxID=3154742 RepID=UPI0033E9E255
MSPTEPPAASDFSGAWCGTPGDRLVLTGGTFPVAPMSPALAGLISHRVTTPGPVRSPRRDDPPPVSGSGLRAVYEDDGYVGLDLDCRRLGRAGVLSEPLHLGVHPAGPYLDSLTFTRCERAGNSHRTLSRTQGETPS